jgi:hypothetical protein
MRSTWSALNLMWRCGYLENCEPMWCSTKARYRGTTYAATPHNVRQRFPQQTGALHPIQSRRRCYSTQCTDIPQHTGAHHPIQSRRRCYSTDIPQQTGDTKKTPLEPSQLYDRHVPHRLEPRNVNRHRRRYGARISILCRPCANSRGNSLAANSGTAGQDNLSTHAVVGRSMHSASQQLKL